MRKKPDADDKTDERQSREAEKYVFDTVDLSELHASILESGGSSRSCVDKSAPPSKKARQADLAGHMSEWLRRPASALRSDNAELPACVGAGAGVSYSRPYRRAINDQFSAGSFKVATFPDVFDAAQGSLNCSSALSRPRILPHNARPRRRANRDHCCGFAIRAWINKCHRSRNRTSKGRHPKMSARYDWVIWLGASAWR